MPLFGPIWTTTKNEKLTIKDWYLDSLVSGRFEFVYKDNKPGRKKDQWDFCVEMEK